MQALAAVSPSSRPGVGCFRRSLPRATPVPSHRLWQRSAHPRSHRTADRHPSPSKDSALARDESGSSGSIGVKRQCRSPSLAPESDVARQAQGRFSSPSVPVSHDSGITDGHGGGSGSAVRSGRRRESSGEIGNAVLSRRVSRMPSPRRPRRVGPRARRRVDARRDPVRYRGGRDADCADALPRRSRTRSIRDPVRSDAPMQPVDPWTCSHSIVRLPGSCPLASAPHSLARPDPSSTEGRSSLFGSLRLRGGPEAHHAPARSMRIGKTGLSGLGENEKYSGCPERAGSARGQRATAPRRR